MSIEYLDTFLGKKPDEKELKKRKLLALIKQLKYGGRGRDWHPAFVEYMYKIVEHPHYAGIPWGIDDKGKIRWNPPSHRPPG